MGQDKGFSLVPSIPDGCAGKRAVDSQSKLASGIALKSVLWLSAQPTGIICHDVETSRQRQLKMCGVKKSAVSSEDAYIRKSNY